MFCVNQVHFAKNVVEDEVRFRHINSFVQSDPVMTNGVISPATANNQANPTISKAFVTLATDDAYAIGALVLAHSLKNVETAQTLHVIFTDKVSTDLRWGL